MGSDIGDLPPHVQAQIAAQGELAEIWAWNVKDKGIRGADSYFKFLKKSISSLSRTYAKGRVVSTRPEFRFMTFKQSTRGHGHIAVYMIEANDVVVLNVFHTSQDWENRLAEEQR